MLERLDTLVAFATVMLGISLLITIINQMIASVLGHRATYLKDGIKDLLETLDPNLAQHAERIANDVLTHKLASDSIFAHQSWAPLRWKLATAIRPEELTKLLNLVSAGQPYAPHVQAILAQVNPTVAREAQLIANTANALAPASAASADQLIQQLSDKATKAIGRVEGAFNSTMDRVRQRFTLQMRIWTVVFSLLFALVYHLDAAKIYSQLSSDPALRASLSDASKGLIQKYSDLADCSQGGTQASVSHGPGTQQSKSAQAPAQDTSTPEQRKEKLECDAKSLATVYKDVRGQISDPKLALFDIPHNWGNFGGFPGLFRILATAALLSLGAPFWYNALKNLVNLRSQVAERQQKESGT
jgi:hypothetical protein